MSDPNDAHYDWLYSGKPKRRPGDAGPDRPVDRPVERPVERPSASQDPEPTRVLAAQPRTTPGSQPPPAGPPPGGRVAASPPRPRRSRRRWVRRALLALVLAWLVFMVAVPIWAWSKVEKVDAEPAGTRPDDTPGTTSLLVGADGRAGVSGSRTDTIMVLHVPDGDGPKLLLSVPRDSYVEIPGRGSNKINAAYAFGGPKLLVATVEQAMGLRVDNYVEIGFTGFVGLIDAVGGVEICPTEGMRDPKAQLNIKKGCQEADGETALGYARSRQFSKGDITRVQHQREVVTQAAGKAASWQTLALPWRYFNVSSSGAESVVVGEDVGVLDMARFAWAVSHMGGKDGLRCVVPYSSLAASTDAGSAVLWDDDKANAIFKAIRADDTSAIRCTED